MKDAARLLGYFAATILFGALAAPILFWAARWLTAHGIFPVLATFDFEAFFNRALMLGALLFLWPFLRWLGIKRPRDLALARNPRWARDLIIGFLISVVPVLCCEIFLLWLNVYTLRAGWAWPAIGQVALTAAIVPLIEEALFRGLFLGVLLRSTRPWTATILSAGIFSIVHFLKAPDETTTSAGWTSGFVSLAHSFDQFAEPELLLAAFTTLFVIGVILAHARLRTQSLWLPIGLHGGWILGSGVFNKIAHREILAMPWLGKSLLIGIIPLCVCLTSWVLLRVWLKYAGARQV
ncbi:MAG: protease family protein [Verrucomicrobiota bacterium]